MLNDFLKEIKNPIMKVLTIPCLLGVLAVSSQVNASSVVINNTINSTFTYYDGASVVDAAALSNFVYENNVSKGLTTKFPGSGLTYSPLSPTDIEYDISSDQGYFGDVIGGMTYSYGIYHDSWSGGDLAVFRAAEKLVIAFRGTEMTSSDDITTDIGLPHLDNSIRVFDKLLKQIAIYAEERKLNVTVTGHSLGGALTNKLAERAENNQEPSYYKQATYIAYASPVLTHYANVFNFGFENDPFYGLASPTTHVGNPIGAYYGEPPHIENIYFAPEDNFSFTGKNPAAHSMVNYLSTIKKFVTSQEKMLNTRSDTSSVYVFKSSQRNNDNNNYYGSYFGSNQGDHTITGNEKNNYFSISGENNTIFGAGGIDYVSLKNGGFSSIVGDITAWVDSNGIAFKKFGSNLFYNVENFGGSSYNDKLTMWGNGDLYGYGGNDILYLRGFGKLYGGSGSDSLYCSVSCIAYGEKGDDHIFGSSENDSIYGGAGKDTLWGGDGMDTFYFYAHTSMYDTITDFNPNKDSIRVGSRINTFRTEYSGNDVYLLLYDINETLVGDILIIDLLNYGNVDLNVSY